MNARPTLCVPAEEAVQLGHVGHHAELVRPRHHLPRPQQRRHAQPQLRHAEGELQVPDKAASTFW